VHLRVCYEKAGILIGFLPLIVYGLLAGSSSGATLALAAATIVTIIAGFPDLRKGMILTWANLLLFGFLFIAVGILGMTGLLPVTGMLIYGTLAAVAFGSIAAKMPFTLQYARGMVDPSLWENPFFIRVNLLMTGAWGGIFAINFVLCSLASLAPHVYGSIASPLTYIILIAGIVFTVWYPRHIRARRTGAPGPRGS
jgi:hypothetical protein